MKLHCIAFLGALRKPFSKPFYYSQSLGKRLKQNEYLLTVDFGGYWMYRFIALDPDDFKEGK